MTVVGVGMDGDGHFFVVNISNREETIKHLKSIMDGDYYINVVEDYGTCENGSLYSKWISWLGNFVQRGYFELLEI